MNQNLYITHFEVLTNYKIKVWFSDSTYGLVDLVSELWGEVFEPLKEESYFKQVYLHSICKTLIWPNGADFAPENLKQLTEVVFV
jgi:hypothetical protein